MADLCCSMAETNTTFQTNYTPLKEIYIKNKQKKYDNQKKKCDLKKKKKKKWHIGQRHVTPNLTEPYSMREPNTKDCNTRQHVLAR